MSSQTFSRSAILRDSCLSHNVLAWCQGEVYVPGFGGARLTIGSQALDLRPLAQVPWMCDDVEEQPLRHKALALALAQDTREQLERMRTLRQDLPAGQRVPLPPCLAERPEVSPWFFLLQASRALWGPDCEGGVALFSRIYPLLPGRRGISRSGLELQAGRVYHSPDCPPQGRGQLTRAYREVLGQACEARVRGLREHVLQNVDPVLEALIYSGEPFYRDSEWTLHLGPDGFFRLGLDFGRFCLQSSDGQWYMAPGPLAGALVLNGQWMDDLFVGQLSVEDLLAKALRVEPHYRHPYVSDGSVCFGGRQRILREAVRRQGIVRQSRLLIAALLATRHLIRRGIVDTGEGLSPFRGLADSDFVAVSWEAAANSGLPCYEYRREKFQSM